MGGTARDWEKGDKGLGPYISYAEPYEGQPAGPLDRKHQHFPGTACQIIAQKQAH